MLLGRRNITQGDTRLFTIDYSDFLAEGVTLSNPTVTVPAGTTSTIGHVYLSPEQKRLLFFATGGNLSETFTASISVQDSNNEVVNDTISFTVVSP